MYDIKTTCGVDFDKELWSRCSTRAAFFLGLIVFLAGIIAIITSISIATKSIWAEDFGLDFDDSGSTGDGFDPESDEFFNNMMKGMSFKITAFMCVFGIFMLVHGFLACCVCQSYKRCTYRTRCIKTIVF